MSVNTNGLIELLESGESCVECDDPMTHSNGDHIGNMDAIFAANDDLTMAAIIEAFPDRVEVDCLGGTFDDWDPVNYPLNYKVILFNDGRIQWHFFDMNYSSYSGDLFSGVYAKEEDAEYEVPGGSLSFLGMGVNTGFQFHPVGTEPVVLGDLDCDEAFTGTDVLIQASLVVDLVQCTDLPSCIETCPDDMMAVCDWDCSSSIDGTDVLIGASIIVDIITEADTPLGQGCPPEE
jgi:hypothetical protein